MGQSVEARPRAAVRLWYDALALDKYCGAAGATADAG